MKPFSLSNAIGFTGVYGVNGCAEYLRTDCTIQTCLPPELATNPARLGRTGYWWATMYSASFPSSSHCWEVAIFVAFGSDTLIVQSCLLFSLSFCLLILCLLRQRTIVSLLPQLLIIAGHSITTFSGFISKTLLEMFI